MRYCNVVLAGLLIAPSILAAQDASRAVTDGGI
jgi:hypothetical protein